MACPDGQGTIDREPFLHFSAAQQESFYTKEGYLLLPSVLSRDEVADLLAEMRSHPIAAASEDATGSRRLDYQGRELDQRGLQASAAQRWPSPLVAELIASPHILEPVRRLLHGRCVVGFTETSPSQLPLTLLLLLRMPPPPSPR